MRKKVDKSSPANKDQRKKNLATTSDTGMSK